MTIRDKRQQEFADIWLKHGKFGILNLCPRFGKIYTSINILETLNPHDTVLIAYPDVKIKDSWLKDFETRGYNNPNVTFDFIFIITIIYFYIQLHTNAYKRGN